MTDIQTKSLGTITEAMWNSALSYFKRHAPKLKENWETSLIYAVGMTFKTGDYSHVNKLLPLLDACGLEPKFRRTVVAHNVLPFTYDGEAGLYAGKIKPGRRAALEMLNENNIPQWEVVLKAALDGEKPENKEPPKFKLETRLPNLIKKAYENGYDQATMRKLFNAALKENAPPVPVQEVKDGIRKEEEAQRKAA